MTDRDRRHDDESESNQRSNNTSYWKNEPWYARQQRDDRQGNSEGTGSDTKDPRRYRDEALEQRDREQFPQGKPDQFENNEFYANQGWTRSAAKERQRDWGYTNDYNYTRKNHLEIDFHRDKNHTPVHDPSQAERDNRKTEGPYAEVGPQEYPNTDNRIRDD